MVPIESNLIVTDLYPRLFMGPTEHNIIVSDLYPRLLTHHPDYNIIVTHPPGSMSGNVLP